jgi:hypothetical protein
LKLAQAARAVESGDEGSQNVTLSPKNSIHVIEQYNSARRKSRILPSLGQRQATLEELVGREIEKV